MKRIFAIFVVSLFVAPPLLAFDIQESEIKSQIDFSEPEINTDISFEESIQQIEHKTEEQSKPIVMKMTGNEWLEDDVPIATLAPTKRQGKLKVGIRWPCNSQGAVDVDLYTRSTHQYHYLFYGRKRSPEGIYYKDYLQSPDASQALEYVDYTKDININDLEIMLNFYAGHCPGGPKGVIRAWYEGDVYELPFHIKDQTGNRGGTRGGYENNKHWAVVNTQKLFHFQ